MHSLYQNPQANVKYLDLTHLTMTRAENLVTPVTSTHNVAKRASIFTAPLEAVNYRKRVTSGDL